MPKAYTDEFLISELQRFYYENNRIPTTYDMTNINGYPSFSTYHNRFGSFNNALEAANLEINKTHENRIGNEICCKCGCTKKETQHWHTKGLSKDEVMCRNCYHNINYKNGILDKNSNTGKGLIGQRVVAKTLNLSLENDCNCSVNFGHPFDLYDEDRYRKIDVKTSKLSVKNIWSFKFLAKKEADNYICLGFDKDRKNILHVWVVPNEGKIKNIKNLSITNTNCSLEFYNKFEVDVKPYNDMLHKMSKKRKETDGIDCVLSNDDLKEVI